MIGIDEKSYFVASWKKIRPLGVMSTAVRGDVVLTWEKVLSADGYIVYEALEYLSQDEDGFFLMAEGSHIDHGGHDNDIRYMLDELLAFDLAVETALAWAKDRNDTVVIVTADHETGGLQLADGITTDIIRAIYDDKSVKESLYYSWTTTGHTPTDVYCFVNGADINFEEYSSFNDKYRIKNTDIFYIIQDLFGYTPTV